MPSTVMESAVAFHVPTIGLTSSFVQAAIVRTATAKAIKNLFITIIF
jgi:hypothetical protein